MRINLNLYENNRGAKTINNNVAFGMTGATSLSRAHIRANSASQVIAKNLGLDYETVRPLLLNLPYDSVEFFKKLAARFRDGVTRKLYEGDNPEKVIGLFKEVKEPNDIHMHIINHIAGSVEDLSKMFKLILNYKTLEVVEKFKNDIIGNHRYCTSLIPNVLESVNSKEYLNHTDKYFSYLKLNLKNPNAIANLDKLLAEGKYSSLPYDRDYYLDHLYHKTDINKLFGTVLNDEILHKYYSNSGYKFLREFFAKYLGNMDILIPKENHIDIVRMYSTTNSKNLKLRLGLLEKFRIHGKDVDNNPKMLQSEITAMRELFDRMDKDKYVREFVRKVVSNGFQAASIKELETLMDTVSPKKAFIFYKNFSRLVSRAKITERSEAFKNGLMNPFYETTQMRKVRIQSQEYGFYKSSIRNKVKKAVSNFVNVLRYKLATAETLYTAEHSLAETRNLMQEITQNSKPVEQVISNSSPDVFKTPFIISTSVTPKKFLVTAASSEVVKNIKLAKRAEAIAAVNDIISKKLGKKTLEFQQDEYIKKFTKMRLNLLPEMFASVKENRAFYRAHGIKIDIKNADVVDLYSKINGNNRKLVNYMLKKRDFNGNRLFSVNDISELLNKSTKIVREMKEVNPKMRAVDVKAYYNNIFNSYVEKYGKVKYTRKKASIKKPQKASDLKKAS